ncbi:patatin-like phospholipase family protein [bacterium]|nr:patatin-like phospholipase family protein [bacterium]
MARIWTQYNKLKAAFGPASPPATYGLVLSGGGARAAYQAGVLQYIADHLDPAPVDIITGVSAGSINAAQLANDPGTFKEAVGHLIRGWSELESHDVYHASTSFKVVMSMLRRSSDQDQELLPRAGLVDTSPLNAYMKKVLRTPDGVIHGIGDNIRSGKLKACAFVTTDYSTAQTVSWVQGAAMEGGERPNRISRNTTLTVDHIMASTSLPFLFPAIPINNHWYGDGGIRQAEPLSPAVHLGATKILAISTRYSRTMEEAARPLANGYPPAAQIFGVLLSAVFLDRLDQDAMTLERTNKFIAELAPWKRMGMRHIDLHVMRPSRDLGKLSSEYEHDLEGVLRLIARGLGSKDTESPDWLSMILFDSGYTSKLIEIGYQDAKNQHEKLARFIQT